MVHMKTRKKYLVSQLAHEGLIISYKPIKSIQRCINNQLCSKYLAEDIVCPSKLQTGLFPSATIGNIDHNQSSVAAITSFHGTSSRTYIIFQYENHPVKNVPIQYDMNNPLSSKTNLPSHYTNIEPSKEGKPEPPAVLMSVESCQDKKKIK